MPPRGRAPPVSRSPPPLQRYSSPRRPPRRAAIARSPATSSRPRASCRPRGSTTRAPCSRTSSAARQAQEGAVGDEPIRIPGADEYRAPERFREDLLEAMKKKGAVAPEGYDDQIKRYYEELIR